LRATFFATPSEFRAWLERHHASKKELLVGFYKRGSGKPSITWPESVDQALCFGWIDGVRRSAGADSYTIRFTQGEEQLVNAKKEETRGKTIGPLTRPKGQG
jgi:uncharacterized protein YdeI (YjbR/CyaY-like superfamily)